MWVPLRRLHGPRTPLTLQQTIVDVALADPDPSEAGLRAALLRVRAAGQEQERLIDALLTPARSQRGLEAREYVDLAAVVRGRLPGRSDTGAPTTAYPRVEARLESAPVLGDPQLIERLVANLTDSAVRHNLPAGERGWVSVWTGLDAQGCPGLPDGGGRPAPVRGTRRPGPGARPGRSLAPGARCVNRRLLQG
ncbi:hypothetical protein [Streptomyces sp. NPDC001980]|uniref:hypothetical protein n=1 Tax=Streptomyces sp. NPDC001980 TaxID=3157126 RepID=UPI0033220E9D